ncbi:MAG: peptidylprolyl isomerase [Candidatus Heimdallarchaeota archaeon]|nr:peptidylprolyl isomerase [Candidatus Heimdallarchaeota archaeon]
MPAKKGDFVKVEYQGFLDDGRIFDSTEQHGFPLKLTIGAGVYLDALENALIGMEVDEEKTIHLSPKEAYGEHLNERVETIERKTLPTKKELEEGSLIVLTSSEGEETPAKVIDLTETEVTLDFNHPLAGIPLNFRITLLEII